MHKIFEIRVTDTRDDTDMATDTYYSQDENKTATELIETVKRAIYSQHELEFYDASNRFITISPCSDDEGYYYTIYETKADYDANNDSHGGQCTGTLSDAITMAIS